MSKLKTFLSLVLLITTSTMSIYPYHPLIRPITLEERDEERKASKIYTASYDDIILFLDQIESDELEEKCPPEEIEKVKHFITFLAQKGNLSDDSEESLSLESDTENLLDGEVSLYENLTSFHSYEIIPALLHEQRKILLCKSFAKKQWKQVKKFAKKHKKALIIGAAIVVTATIVIAIAAGSSVAGAAGLGAAKAAGNTGSSKKDQQKSSPTTPLSKEISSEIKANHEALKSTIDRQISSFKENVLHNRFFQTINNKLFPGKKREEP